jgi:hypothetical protein
VLCSGLTIEISVLARNGVNEAWRKSLDCLASVSSMADSSTRSLGCVVVGKRGRAVGDGCGDG